MQLRLLYFKKYFLTSGILLLNGPGCVGNLTNSDIETPVLSLSILSAIFYNFVSPNGHWNTALM